MEIDPDTIKQRHELPARYNKLPAIGPQHSLSSHMIEKPTQSGYCLLHLHYFLILSLVI